MRKTIYKLVAVLITFTMILCDNSIISFAEEIGSDTNMEVYDETVTEDEEEGIPKDEEISEAEEITEAEETPEAEENGEDASEEEISFEDAVTEESESEDNREETEDFSEEETYEETVESGEEQTDVEDTVEDTITENSDEVIAIEDCNAEGNIASGTSNNVTWVIDEGGKLTISGTGDWKREGEGETPKFAPWYAYCEQIKAVEVKLSDATNLSNMFYRCENVTSFNFSDFDTSGVTDMTEMFSGCFSIATLDVSNFDTSSVLSMHGMFASCSELNSLDLSKFDTSNVTDMCSMFSLCTKLSKLDIGNFNTKNVSDMYGMFYYCLSLSDIDLSSFDTSKVTRMSSMFYFCQSITDIELSGFNTKNVTEMNSMFEGCYRLRTLDLSSFNTFNVTDMLGMFSKCQNLTTLDISSFDTSNIYDFSDIALNYMDSMFDGCISLSKIVTPKKCPIDADLPIGKTWKDSTGKKYTKIPNTSKTLFANDYVEVTYSISYELNGGVNNKDNPDKYADSKTVTLKNPTKVGYSFGGWFSNASFNGNKVTTVKNKNITVYAKWTANIYTITLNGNGGKYTPPEGGKGSSTLKMNMTYDVADILSNPFIREGYTFAGWTSKKDGKGTFYAADDEVKNLTKTNKANINLYAKWEANEYTINFDYNATEVYEGDLGGEMLPVKVKYGKNVKLPANMLTRKGYTFKGWSTDLSGKVKYKNKATVKNLALTGDVTLYAVWSINTYSVKFNANGGKGKAPATVNGLQYGVKSLTLPENSFTNKDVYTFVGWNTKPNGLGVDYAVGDTVNLVATKNKQVFTLYPIWQYDLRVSTGDDKCIAFYTEYNWVINVNELVKSFEQIEPKVIKNGYYIAGFATSQKNADKGKITYKGSIKNVAGKILYPVYKVNKYTIKFDANGGTGKMKNVTATYDKDVTLPKNAFKNGSKTFLGWATSSSSSSIEYGNKEVVKNLSNENKGVVKLYAVWGD